MKKPSSGRQKTSKRYPRLGPRRRVNEREIRQRFLIVCEGTETEPNYFRAFRVPKNVIDVDIRGLGCDPKRIIQETERIQREEDDDFDQIWCVFDRDSFPPERFNAAVGMARQKEYYIAYSNEAFELWYLLHYDYIDTGLSRTQYQEMLDQRLGIKYKKNHNSMYELLEDRMQKAIGHAKKLLEQYDPPNPERDNPSTTVHLLVEILLKNAV